MSTAEYRIHRLIQDLMRDPAAAAAFAKDPEPLFERYRLSERERALLRDGSPRALIELGVHPNLQMKFQRLARAAPAAAPGLLDEYLDRLCFDDTEAAVAAALRGAYGKTPIEPFAARLGKGDVARAYRVQELNTRHWMRAGRRMAGRKIGLTSEAVQKQLGVDQPDYGVLFEDMRVANGGRVGATLLQPRIEAEIALIMQSDVTAAEAFEAAVGAVTPALEIVDSRVRDWRISIVDTIADNASSAAFVLSDARTVPQGVDLVNCTMRLYAGEELVSQGRGAACLGNPLRAGAWLAAKMIEVGRPLRAGDIVLSGALGPMVAMKQGTSYRAEIDGLGGVAVSF